MRLYEFSGDDSVLPIKLVGIISQLHGRIDDTGTQKPYSLSALLNTLSKNGLHVSEEQFRDMVDEEPLKNLIANVKGDKVIFKGHGDSDSEVEEPDQSTDTLKKMAKRAEKKRD